MKREEILRAIREKGVKKGNFLLSSGKRSSYYVDIKLAYTERGVLKAIAEQLSMLIDEHGISFDKVAGIELGAVAIVVALSIIRGSPFVIVRKAEKSYGVKERVIGRLIKGEKVLIIEDVATTGSSIISCAEALREKGAKVEHAIAVVDRGEGAKENLRKFNIELLSLFKAKEVLE